MMLAKDAPNAPAPKSLAAYLEPLKTADAWWLMGFYAVTFGGFVGLAASLPIYFTDRFGLTHDDRRLLHRGLRVRRLADPADGRRAGGPRSAG